MLFDPTTHQFVRGGKISDKPPKKQEEQKKGNASTTALKPGNKQARAVTASLKHKHLVVCNNLGKVSFRSWDNFDSKIHAFKVHDWSEAIRYSPCENYLAVGSHDNHTYIYKIDEETHEYKQVTKDHAHSAWINAIDWTTDSSFIRTSSGDYEVLYFNVAENKYDPEGKTNTQDKTWATNTIKYGEDRKDITPSGVETKAHIRSVIMSPEGSNLISGDNFGLVNLFMYPDAKTEVSNSYSAHSEHVVCVVQSKDGKTIFSVGGADKALIQWKLESKK